MTDFFQLSDTFKNKILNPFWTPPPGAKMPKRGKDVGIDGIWDEPVTIEDYQASKAENGDATVIVTVRVDGDTETENAGQSHRERIWFPASALGKNPPSNMLQAFTFSYQKLIQAFHAAGNEGTPDPGSIDPDSMRGAQVMVTVKVGPDKNGVRRMEIVGFQPPAAGSGY